MLSPQPPRQLVTLLAALLLAALTILLAPATAGVARADAASVTASAPGSSQGQGRIEDYAGYDGASRCSPRAKPGTVRLQRWMVATFGGAAGPISRACGGSVSEHTEGRALDWTVDARSRADRRRVDRFLGRVFATDADGNEHALARRMGIMYIIWNDRIYRSYERFDAGRYLSSSCSSRRQCSATLRHRDHVHVSLSWPGARARTSWYR